MEKRLRWLILLAFLVLVLSLVCFLYDREIVRTVEDMRHIYLDYVFLSLFFASNVIIVFLFVFTLFLFRKSKRKWVVALGSSILLSGLLSYILKTVIHRPRPFQEGHVSVFNVILYFMVKTVNKWNFSFPSFQAMLVFCVLPIISKEFRKFRYIWLVFAILVAFSRVYFGVHYMSDVLIGGLLGYLIGYIMVLIEQRFHYGEKLVKKMRLV